MPLINFCKFHGFGNDYVIFDAENLHAIENLNEFSKNVCRRNTGIGGDGIAVLSKSKTGAADYSCRIINPDGSEAGFSGNGTRCAVAYLYYKNLWDEKSFRLETKSGIKNYELLKRENFTYWFLAELGKPKFDLPEMPLNEENKTPDTKEFGLLIPSEEMAVKFTFVDVGNPVAVVFLEDFGQMDWRGLGSKIENAPMFPERTNVVFVKIIDRENIEIRIWERGAGETSSSGTCSIAAAVASAYTDKTDRKVAVHAEGGTTESVWREDGEMLITGRADLAFCGEFFA
ncbi:MAG: diaminopimelate epimerase [Pyrinomonadaceae bacterium]